MKNRSARARSAAGLTIANAAPILGLTVEDLARIETSDEAYVAADRQRLANVYGVNIEWLDDDRELRDYSAVDGIAGADRLTSHDRDIIAEFAAAMRMRKP